MTQAFEGITILDFTQVLAGPFGVMQLALLGARVIKVEQPGSGDQTRGLMNEGKDAGMSPSFMAVNLNISTDIYPVRVGPVSGCPVCDIMPDDA